MVQFIILFTFSPFFSDLLVNFLPSYDVCSILDKCLSIDYHILIVSMQKPEYVQLPEYVETFKNQFYVAVLTAMNKYCHRG